VQQIYKLKGGIQHYSWGGYSFIPQLLGIENNDKLPFAEYWLGAHPNHPSYIVLQDGDQRLDQFIEVNSELVLGKATSSKYESLPYLLKVLDVKQMLSIQVHPSKEEAAKGFELENNSGVPMNAPHRNYKDANQKPEMMVALSSFWLLHGFKTGEEIENTLRNVQEFKSLLDKFLNEGLKGLYQYVMTMPQSEVNQLLKPLAERLLPLYKENELLKSSADFWAARAIETFCKKEHFDRGILSIYLMNLVHLKEGEGIFQPAGMPHAYLEGQNVEIMANSDNVLRAGLTDKHIDVAELMKHVHYTPTDPAVLKPGQDGSFDSSAAEFGLYKYDIEAKMQNRFMSKSAEILLVLEGNVQVQTQDASLMAGKGESFFIVAGADCKIIAEANATVFRATIGRI